jgi:hypothetical protein
MLVFYSIGMCRKGGKYHCTVNLLFDWFGISCRTTDNFCFYLQNRLIQTSQTGGQPFSIPWYVATVINYASKSVFYDCKNVYSVGHRLSQRRIKFARFSSVPPPTWFYWKKLL